MRSGTSFFNGTLYRKTLTRFWPLWAINLVIWIFILPLNGLMELSYDQLDPEHNALIRFACNVGNTAELGGVVFAVLAGVVMAMAVCSHLYNNRSANFVAALPVRREGQFISTYLAGLTMLLAPNVIVFLLTLLVEAAGGAVVWSSLLYWLAALSGMEFFFYSFAVCVGQFAGHVLVLPVFYAIFNALVVAVSGMLLWIMEAFYFGFASTGLPGFVYWCTPAVMLLEPNISVNYVEKTGELITQINDLWIVGVYAIVAVVLTVCALLLYRRRHMETAGDIVAVRVMRPVFKYSVAFCAGMFLGYITSYMLGVTVPGLMASVLIWAVVGYFVAQMLLDKSIRVFRKWKGAAAVVVVFLALFAVIGFDLTGYETRVPNAGDVQSAAVSGLGAYPNDTGSHLDVELTDPEIIADVVALHEAIVELGPDGEGNNSDYVDYCSFRVTYTLKSGAKMSRFYSVPMGDRVAALVQTIRDYDEVRYKTYLLDTLEALMAERGEPDLFTASIHNYNDGSGADFTGADVQRLWDAVMADFEARRIGVHTVINDFYYGDIQAENELYFERSWKDGKNYINLSIWFVVPEQASETWEVLEELMLVDNRYQDDATDNPLARE